MTTKITVDAHAGWPVQVVAQDTMPDGAVYHTELAIVPANQVQDFYVHSTRKLIITEIPRA